MVDAETFSLLENNREIDSGIFKCMENSENLWGTTVDGFALHSQTPYSSVLSVQCGIIIACGDKEGCESVKVLGRFCFAIHSQTPFNTPG